MNILTCKLYFFLGISDFINASFEEPTFIVTQKDFFTVNFLPHLLSTYVVIFLLFDTTNC